MSRYLFSLKRSFRGKKHSWLPWINYWNSSFTIMIFCSECGSAFGRKNWSTSQGKRKVWQCNNQYRIKGQIGCLNNHIDEEMLEKAVMKAVWLFQEHRSDVVFKWQKLEQVATLLHKHYAKQMYQILDLENLMDLSWIKFSTTSVFQKLDKL